MSKKDVLPKPTQELIKALGTKQALKKKLNSLPESRISKLALIFAEASAEVLLEREKDKEESLRVQKIIEATLSTLSEEHNIPLDVIKARTNQL